MVMETMVYKDAVGNEWKEIIYRNKARLEELKAEYEKRGYKGWIFPYKEDKYVLSLTMKNNEFLHFSNLKKGEWL